MGEADGLKVGMTMAQVRAALRGWTDRAKQLSRASPDKQHFFHTWDFIPPDASGESTLRLTFDNDMLLVWGDPADTHVDDESAGAA